MGYIQAPGITVNQGSMQQELSSTIKGWIEILPHLKSRPSPLKKLPHGNLPIEYHDYIHGGLCPDQELQEWKHELSFPSSHQVFLKSICYGSCLQERSCPTTEDSDILKPQPPYTYSTECTGNSRTLLRCWEMCSCFNCVKDRHFLFKL